LTQSLSPVFKTRVAVEPENGKWNSSSTPDDVPAQQTQGEGSNWEQVTQGGPKTKATKFQLNEIEIGLLY